MGINLQLPKLTELKPRITVIGVGGAGGNAVNNMISSGLTGVEFVVANTDAQALLTSSAEKVVQLGVNQTAGLGAGARPETGEAAAEEVSEELRETMSGAHMVFIACGMGGGTGTGAAAVIARIAKEMDILTVGIVTKPFQFEGARRMRIAEAGIEELKNYVDTLIVIPNQNLFRIASEKTTFAEAFILADQVLYSGIACIVDLIIKEGLINLDFADVRAIMSGMGSAMMGTGEGEGERRATIAAEEAISNPLLDGLSLKGARGLLLSIVGNKELTLYEVDEAASRVRQEVDPDANIIVGAGFDDSLGDRVRVSIVASGLNGAGGEASEAAPASRTSDQSLQEAEVSPPPLPATKQEGGDDGAPVGTAQAKSVAPNEGGEYQRLLAQDQQAADAQRGTNPAAAGQSLSEAVRHNTQVAPPQGSASSAAPLWQAPGDVTIEPLEQRLNTSLDTAAATSKSGQQHIAGNERGASQQPKTTEPAASAFVPQPPPNRAPQKRRMPAVEEFPMVGQREYHAKARAAAGQAMQTPAKTASAQPTIAQPPRKPGFFERLTGRRGQAGDATTSNHSRSTASASYPQEGRGAAEGTAKRGPSAETGKPEGDDLRTRDSEEHVDLPMFFNNGRR